MFDEHCGLSAAARQQGAGTAPGASIGTDVRRRMGSQSDIAVPRARGSEAFAALMLATACLCWATFFSLTKNWQEAAKSCPGGPLLASLTLLGIRPVLALAVFALVRPGLFRGPTRREWRI